MLDSVRSGSSNWTHQQLSLYKGSYRHAWLVCVNQMHNSLASQGIYYCCVKHKIRNFSNYAFFWLWAIKLVTFYPMVVNTLVCLGITHLINACKSCKSVRAFSCGYCIHLYVSLVLSHGDEWTPWLFSPPTSIPNTFHLRREVSSFMIFYRTNGNCSKVGLNRM